MFRRWQQTIAFSVTKYIKSLREAPNVRLLRAAAALSLRGARGGWSHRDCLGIVRRWRVLCIFNHLPLWYDPVYGWKSQYTQISALRMLILVLLETGFWLLKTGFRFYWPSQRFKFQAQLKLVIYDFLAGHIWMFDENFGKHSKLNKYVN